MRGRTAIGSLGLVALVALAQGCASVAPPPPPAARPTRPEIVPRVDRPLLLNPVENYPYGLDEGRRSQISSAYRRLIDGAQRSELVATAERMLEVDPGLAPALVLAAQAELRDGDFAAAAQRLQPVVSQMPEYTAAVLALALADQELGRLVEACEGYLSQRQLNPEAARRAERLLPRALEIVSRRFSESMDRGRFERAERELDRLEAWAPSEEFSLEARRAFASATGDASGELKAIRALVQRRPEDAELRRRQGDLELAVGDSTAGLQIFQHLAAEFPDDGEIAEALEVARFRWRLQLLPEEVRAIAATHPELDRSQFASLLYWLVPDVRYGRPRRARIANDILDHEHREEISRVVNLGLMRVDSTLHHFAPDRMVVRGEALLSLLMILEESDPVPACLGGRHFDQRSSLESLCEAAARCLLLSDRSECLPRAAVTGPEAVEMVRRTLHQQ